MQRDSFWDHYGGGRGRHDRLIDISHDFQEPLPGTSYGYGYQPRDSYADELLESCFQSIHEPVYYDHMPAYFDNFQLNTQPLHAPVPRRATLSLVLGSSHVRRMYDLLRERGIQNFHLPYADHEVIVHGQGGLRYLSDLYEKSVISKLPIVDQLRANIVVLQLGSNDIDHFTPREILDMMWEVACFCVDSGAQRVILCHLWRREDELHNYRVKRINAYMTREIRRWADPHIFVWKHRGLSVPRYRFLKDKVHLTDYYQWKLFRSLRGAITYHKWRLPRI